MSEIIFVVEQAPEGGFSARALEASIFTQAETIEELHANVRDAVRCHFDNDDVPKMIRLH
jgi:predicted RNase H-like HicB family nuclease